MSTDRSVRLRPRTLDVAQEARPHRVVVGGRPLEVVEQIAARRHAGHASMEQPEVAQHVRQELAILRHALGTGEGARRAAACVGQFVQAAETRAAATVPG